MENPCKIANDFLVNGMYGVCQCNCNCVFIIPLDSILNILIVHSNQQNSQSEELQKFCAGLARDIMSSGETIHSRVESEGITVTDKQNHNNGCRR